MGPGGETHGRPTKLVIPFCGPIEGINLLVTGGIGGGGGGGHCNGVWSTTNV